VNIDEQSMHLLQIRIDLRPKEEFCLVNGNR
jgi:hypothetical protein